MMLDLSTMIYRIPALLFAISIHEYAHAQCADSMGDPTARYAGRLTFNPLAHLDPIGAVLLVVAGFGWAKGVPINVNNFRNRREGILKVSFAGPAANLFLCFLAALLMALTNRLGLMSDGMYRFLLWMQLYNVWFAFFNLIPIPPLDGSRILSELLPAKQSWQFNNIVDRYGFFILIALVFTGITGMIINPLANGYLMLVNSLLRIVF
ncbi:site-2 protease family protein [uncultured Phascolarctobacterium sp.]|uniref:site-2 protease family protein n=1 Tax=uncultured Phascolarctobacterium sp. TaxID=512296 RepID=UPI0025CBBD27|nr:site-2 protease family protein [uncultured Phascolarctobacterium sp.]